MGNERFFTVDALYKAGKRLRTNGGRYTGATPATAAKKAFSQYFRKHKSSKSALEVHIRETTRGSSDKIFKYKVSKVKSPSEVVRSGETIVYTYITKIRSI